MNTVSNLSAGQDQVVRPLHIPRTPVSGTWHGDAGELQPISHLQELLSALDQPLYVIESEGTHYLSSTGSAELGQAASQSGYRLCGWLPAMGIQELGDPDFCNEHRIKFPYMTGSMANGIASVQLVQAVARAGMLGSFGAAGLMIDEVEQALQQLQQELGDTPFCSNLIHSPNETGMEDAVVDLYLRYKQQLVETSAYLDLTLPVVRYRLHGIHVDANGKVNAPNKIIAKCSRIEIASKWFSPAPAKLVQQLLADGVIDHEQAKLAESIPMATDITVEADSGGHTDNRPALTLLPTILALRDRLQEQYNYEQPLRVGLGGGIATPASAAAAFAMGAAYIVTGTVNQACRESGSSDIAREMLAQAEQADVVMAPAVDMFEMGVKLQVLKRGTMFAMRGNRLYELYKTCNSIEEIPEKERQAVEKTIFRAPLTEIWEKTREFFLERDPKQVQRAETDSKHKLALICRWYLGLSSRWANAGVEDRKVDYQIWCGPAMGAFNEWTKDSWLQTPASRDVVTVAMNILYGAAFSVRTSTLGLQGLGSTAKQISIAPVEAEKIKKYFS